jgi:hypothetical protein
VSLPKILSMRREATMTIFDPKTGQYVTIDPRPQEQGSGKERRFK